MVKMLLNFVVLRTLLLFARAKEIFITVGGNTTADPGAVFKPQSVIAKQGDVVVFNCAFALISRVSCPNARPLSVTLGNHTATQALFASPCIPAHNVDATINSFDSGFRPAGNFSAITYLRIVIDNPNETVWFYDYNTCSEGGVGGINVNESSWETLDGFAVCPTPHR